jgi:hypothetical protein
MGRNHEEMTEYIESIQDSYQEYMWKVFAYHRDWSLTLNTWLRSLNKYLPKLRLLNLAKGGGYNVDREYLHDNLTKLFQPHDLDQLNANWSETGFPVVCLSDDAVLKIQALSDKYVDLILSRTGYFTVSTDELL